MKANNNIPGEVERLDNLQFKYFLGELYGDNSLRTMPPPPLFGLPNPVSDTNVPSSGPPLCDALWTTPSQLVYFLKIT
ncbi:hypothetical protein BDA96_06G126300 [Sorghum bicolor]|uniref:Uncharacterized protein n=2 Tax=Sorghum bicolor TaxID=4558 RepID=A0A921QQY0_SORBI|nr:hypothetical protein BDA96_06G126300 [Sorghum bicolor]KXG26517.1 hypothetical protein SORBI_3006G114000 [Sorghum bicolor]